MPLILNSSRKHYPQKEQVKPSLYKAAKSILLEIELIAQ
jgi:hypothetical protein